MSQSSSIEWTEHTWNPVTGCSKVSPGCARCYAEAVALRFWPSQYPPIEYYEYSVDTCCPVPEARAREFTDVQCHEDRITQPMHWRKPRKVFVNSMSDLFHEDVPDAFIDRVFAAMALAPRHVFQVLTKRAQRMHDYMVAASERWGDRRGGIESAMYEIGGDEDARTIAAWPLPNVWLGVSVENQHFVDERIPLLLDTQAAVRFISAEPLLSGVSVLRYLRAPGPPNAPASKRNYLDWVIVGGESGRGSRPFDLVWARTLVFQCKLASVPCFVKQLGAAPFEPYSDGTLFVELHLKSRKGGDMAEWPEDLRVRQFPTSHEVSR